MTIHNNLNTQMFVNFTTDNKEPKKTGQQNSNNYNNSIWESSTNGGGQPTNISAKQPLAPPSTGDVVSVRNEDGTTYQINVKGQTITKYNPNGEVIEQRPMTQEEQAYPTQLLISKLQTTTKQPEVVVANQPVTPPSTGDVVSVKNKDGSTYQINIKEQTITIYNKEGINVGTMEIPQEAKGLSTEELIKLLQTETKPEQPEDEVKKQPTDPPTPRKVSGNGVEGSYTIVEKEDGGYKVEFEMNVNTLKNQAATAFQKNSKNDYGLSNIRPDDDGYYNFRGIKSRNINRLLTAVSIRSQELAAHTAIYKDLQARQSNGESLTDAEQKFMSNYPNYLQKYGLQMNANGEIEDIK